MMLIHWFWCRSNTPADADHLTGLQPHTRPVADRQRDDVIYFHAILKPYKFNDDRPLRESYTAPFAHGAPRIANTENRNTGCGDSDHETLNGRDQPQIQQQGTTFLHYAHVRFLGEFSVAGRLQTDDRDAVHPRYS